MSAKVAQKAVQASKAKKAPAHPPFKQMIIEAINHLNDSKGASRKAIGKVIEDKYAPKRMSTFLNKNLNKMIESGRLKHPKNHSGKFLINVEKPQSKPKKTQKKKEITKKPKSDKKPKKATGAKKAKSPSKKKRTIKSTKKKSPVKKAGPKKVKAPPAPKKSPHKGKKGRGRPKQK